MKIGLLSEGEILPGATYAQRYEELIEEVRTADRYGYHCWGTSEQHFAPPRFTVSAPEVLYAAIARETKNIQLRIMCSVLLRWNHPLLVAERLATLDIVSGGRAQISTARSNNIYTLSTFGVSPSETKAQWEDTIQVLAKALTSTKLSHDGPFFPFEERELVPTITEPKTLSVAASSASSCQQAGQMGIGALLFESYFGMDYMQKCIDAFRSGITERTNPLPVPPSNEMGLYVATAFCDRDAKVAVDKSRNVMLGYAAFIADLYAPLAKKTSYEYLDEHMARFLQNQSDVDFLMRSPSVLVGTPTQLIERLEELSARGIDEVLLRIDGMPHHQIVEAITLIGEEVIPHFARKK